MTDIESKAVRGFSAGWPFAKVIFATSLGIAFCVAAWLAVASWEDRLSRQEFSESAADHVQSLQAGLDRYMQMIKGLRSFFDASNEGVTRDEFTIFTKDFLKNQTAILSFGWIPRVRLADRIDHELAGRSAGIPDYQIKSVGLDGQMVRAPDQEEYFPTFYSNEPMTAQGYGINLLDGGVRQQPLDRARDSNSLATSGNFRLQSGAGDRTGFIVVLPVYGTNNPHDTIEDRRRNLSGFVQGVFQFHVLIDTILADAKSPQSILLYDKIGNADDLPIYVRATDSEQIRLGTRSRSHVSKLSWTGDLNAGDRTWQVVVLPSADGGSHLRHDRAWIVLLAGLLITGLGNVYLMTSINHVRRLEKANENAFRLAHTDPLTELANRRAFVERLTAVFADTLRGNDPFAVHFIDLDEFKNINDIHGHACGDALLKEIAERLTGLVRANDLVARFGGDEFAVLQTGVVHAVDASTFAQKVIDLLAAPYTINGIDLRVTASVGIALYGAQEDGPKDIMIQADLALYRAKSEGRNGFSFHSDELSQDAHLRITLADELKNAIGREELECYYQPQVEIRSGRITGLEALVRWNHPQRGLIMPSLFIPVAEKSGVIQQLGRWVFETAFAQMAQWESEGIAPQTLAVNISSIQLSRIDECVHEIKGAMVKWKMKPNTIELELTETVLMNASQKHSEVFERLREMGLGMAIDDFGTGYSSLKYLTVYPVNKLKIAQELVLGVTENSRNATVVKAAIHLARELGIQVIAEGVETEAQARFLLAAGCGFAQGYFYEHPVNAAAATLLLKRGTISSKLTEMPSSWRRTAPKSKIA